MTAARPLWIETRRDEIGGGVVRVQGYYDVPPAEARAALDSADASDSGEYPAPRPPATAEVVSAELRRASDFSVRETQAQVRGAIRGGQGTWALWLLILGFALWTGYREFVSAKSEKSAGAGLSAFPSENGARGTAPQPRADGINHSREFLIFMLQKPQRGQLTSEQREAAQNAVEADSR